MSGGSKENYRKLATIIRDITIEWIVHEKETYYSTEKIISEESDDDKRAAFEREIAKHKEFMYRLLKIRMRSFGCATRMLFHRTEDIDFARIIKIIYDDMDYGDDASQYVIRYLKHYAPKELINYDEVQTAKLTDEWAEIGSYACYYMRISPFMKNMINIMIKARNCQIDEVSDITGLTFVNEYGQLIDDKGEELILGEMFTAVRWEMD